MSLVDFLIVGGGIAGLSAGARLSELGSVLLIEAETALGYHASGRSAAMFEETYGKPSTLELNSASRAFLEHADGGFLSPRGLMLVASDAQLGDFEKDLVTMQMDALSPADAQALLPILDPDAVARCGYRADAWDIDTDRLLQFHARTIRANSGTVLTGAAVTGIQKKAGAWEVVAGGSRYEARMVLNAAGAWADEVAGLAGVEPIGIQPFRRSMARIPAPGGQDVSAWPMVFGAGETWYAKPDAGALIVSPADEDASEPMDAWADDMVLAEGLARYEEMVTEPVTRLLSNWAGLRSFAPDRCLVLGPDPAEAQFFWIAGQGGYGFQTSPAASAYVADLIAGRAPHLSAQTRAALSPSRFRA